LPEEPERERKQYFGKKEKLRKTER